MAPVGIHAVDRGLRVEQSLQKSFFVPMEGLTAFQAGTAGTAGIAGADAVVRGMGGNESQKRDCLVGIG
jgi:hypothetical protein